MTNNNEQMTVKTIVRLVKMSDEKYEQVCKDLRAVADGKGNEFKVFVEELLKLTDRMRGNKEEPAATE